MPLSWNEIKARAAIFTKEWEDETNEHAEVVRFSGSTIMGMAGGIRFKLNKISHSPDSNWDSKACCINSITV